MRKAKSRLKAYKNKKRLENITAWSLLPVLFTWLAVFCSLKGTKIINSNIQAYEYKPPIIIEKIDHSKTEKEQIFNYIVDVFGEDSADAITIINKCENHAFNPNAENWNSNGTWDAGIFQINQIHGYSIEQMKDWKQNIDAAKKIFDNGGWKQWSCSHIINIKSFWQ